MTAKMDLTYILDNKQLVTTKSDSPRRLIPRSYKRKLTTTPSKMTYLPSKDHGLYTITESPYLEDSPSMYRIGAPNAIFSHKNRNNNNNDRQYRKQTVLKSMDIIMEALDVVGVSLSEQPPSMVVSDDDSTLTSLDDSEHSLTKLIKPSIEGKSLLRSSCSRWNDEIYDSNDSSSSFTRNNDRPPTCPVRRNSRIYFR